MNDLTQGNILKALIKFTLPLIAGNLFQQIYTVTDTIIVGQTLGVKALAAVGSTGSLMFLIIGFSQGFSAGTAILTAQRFGAKDWIGLKRSMVANIISGLLVNIVLTIGSLLGLHLLLTVMQTPSEIFDQAYLFIGIILAGLITVLTYNIGANVLRAVGESRAPIVYLSIGILTNIVLELIAILVWHLGVAGAAISTVVAQAVAGGLSFWHIYHYQPRLAVSLSEWRINWQDIKAHLKIGFPMGFQNSIIAIGALVVQTSLNTLGTASVAATTAAQRIDQFVILILLSLGVGMSTFAAQNYGAKQFDRIQIGLKKVLQLGIIVSIILGIVEVTLGRLLMRGFLDSKQASDTVLDLGQTYFWVHGPFYILLAVLIIVKFTLQGLNKPKAPTLSGVAELLMRGGMAIVLVGPLGYLGVSLADLFAWIGALIVLIPSYRQLQQELNRKTAKDEQ